MPDLSSIANTLVELVAEFLTTNTYSSVTPYQPETVFQSNAQVLANVSGTNQLVNVQCRLFRGYPVPNDLEHDLANGISEITVFTVPGMSRLIGGYMSDSYVTFIVPITFAAVATGNSVTFSGTATAGQVTGIAVGDGEIKEAYCYRMFNTDTPASVAAALQSIIPNSTVNGATITVTGVTSLLTGVVSDYTVNTELARYSQMFDVGIWSPNPQSRDALGTLITLGLAQSLDIQFADGSDSEISYYRGTWEEDANEDTEAWHRHQRIEIPYPVCTQTTGTGILFFGITLNSTKLVGEFIYTSF